MTDLERAIALGHQALRLCPKDHPDRPKHLNSLACYLITRYTDLWEEGDLEDSITLGREALDLCPKGHLSHSKYLHNLAHDLYLRYRLLEEIADLDDAIALGFQALKLCPRGHPDRLMRLVGLRDHLSRRYSDREVVGDLEDAIVLGHESLDLCPQGHPSRFENLQRVAQFLYLRYTRLGAPVDLENAITLRREVVNLCPRGHEGESSFLNNLAVDLYSRFTQLGELSDLEDAIALQQKALDLYPPGQPRRSLHLFNLADDLFRRYQQLAEMADLDNAIILMREALSLYPQGHPERFYCVDYLADHLSARYERLKAAIDLEDAIALRHESLSLCPQGHANRSMSLKNLAAGLSRRYKHLGKMVDLDDAITLGCEALELCPLWLPSRSEILIEVTDYLHNRFMQSNQVQDQQELFDLYAELTGQSDVVSLSDIHAVMAWVDTAEEFRHPSTVLAYQTSLRFLIQHLATFRLLPKYEPILKRYTSSLAVDAFSACLREGNPKKAVELLEHGGVMSWNQLCCLRSPLDDVIASNPAGETLADEFTRLASLVHNTIRSSGPDRLDRLHRLNLEIHKVVGDIREVPGLEHFLLPPLFSELQRAAAGGPVIILNASRHGCDALIIFVDRDPIHIPLKINQMCVRGLSSELQALASGSGSVEVAKGLGRVLRELWDEVVFPIVKVLQSIHPAPPRIWWYPTAEFTLLPLHATGPYRTGQPNFSDLYISSYTPSLTALIHAQRNDPSTPITDEKRFLAIDQAEAVGEKELASVSSELDVVGQRVEGLATFTQIEGPKSSISRISEELVKNEWVHFACHGIPNVDRPSEAAFVLHNGKLTVKYIMELELRHAKFAYLSACQTSVRVNGNADKEIDLASAMQLAGFRSVIRTMWAADDAMATKIASTFYEYVKDASGRLDYTRAAYALNKTMNTLADSVPFEQRVLYVHMGA